MRRRISIFLIACIIITGLSGCSGSGSEAIVTRGEWLSQLTLKFGMYTYEAEAPYYKDVKSSSEYFAAVQIAREWDVIEDAKKIKPDDPVTKGFAAETLARTMGIQGTAKAQLSDCGDYDSNQIGLLVDYDIIPASGEKFSPENRMAPIECDDALEKGYQFWSNKSFADEYVEITYQDEVVDFSELADFPYEVEILEGEAGSEDSIIGVTMSEEQAAGLEAGSIFVLPDSDNPDNPQYLKVVRVEPAGDGQVQVIAEPPQLEEVIEKVDFQGEYTPDYGSTEFADGVTVEVITADAANMSADNEDYHSKVMPYKSSEAVRVSPMWTLDLEGRTEDIAGYEMTVDFGHNIQYKFSISDVYCLSKFNMNIGWSGIDMKYGYLGLNYKVSNIFGTKEKANKTLTKTLATIKIPLTAGFTADVDVVGTLTMEGEFSVSLICNGKIGVEFMQNKPRFDSTMDVEKEFMMNASIEAKADLGVGLRWGWLNGRIIAIGTTAGPKGTASYTTKTNCLDVNGAVKWGVYCKSDYEIGSLKLDLKNEIWNMDNSPYQFNFHMEDGKAVEVCSRSGSSEQEEGSSPDKAEDGDGPDSDNRNIEIEDRDSNLSKTYSMFLKTGQSGTINLNNSGYTFESEDPGVASVTSGGKVTGVASGSTIVNVFDNNENLVVSVAVTVD